VKRIGEIVKGFRARVEALDRRVWDIHKLYVTLVILRNQPFGLLKLPHLSIHHGYKPSFKQLYFEIYTNTHYSHYKEEPHGEAWGLWVGRIKKRRIASRHKIYPLHFIKMLFPYFNRLLCQILKTVGHLASVDRDSSTGRTEFECYNIMITKNASWAKYECGAWASSSLPIPCHSLLLPSSQIHPSTDVSSLIMV